MYSKKIAIAFITSLLIIVVLSQNVFSENNDIRNSELSERLSKIGLMKGDANGFALERRPTRAEVAVILVRMLGKEKELQNKQYTHPFSDVPSWADKYVGYLYENNITTGVSSSLFGSAQYVSLDQYITFSLRVLGYNEKEGDFNHKEYMNKTLEIGLLDNNDLHYYATKDSFTRDDIVGIMFNTLSTNFKGSNLTLLEKLIYVDGSIDEEAAADAGFIKISTDPVKIVDPNLEAKIREITGKKEGDLFASDLLKIKEINAEGLKINSLEGLQYCKNLKVLYIQNNNITNIEPIRELDQIFYILAGRNQISNIDALSGLSNLEYLDLTNNKVVSIKPLESLTRLKFLTLGNNSVEDITPVSQLTNLETLNLLDLNITDIKPLEKLNKLTWLYLAINDISDISPLASMEHLSYLDLVFNKVSDISVLKNLQSLKELDLHGNSIRDISSLSELVNLTKLHLSENNVTDITALSGLVNLKTLHLADNSIADYSPIKDIYGQLEDKDFNITFK